MRLPYRTTRLVLGGRIVSLRLTFRAKMAIQEATGVDLFDPEGPSQIRSNHLALLVYEMSNHRDAIDPPSVEEVAELIDVDNLPVVLAAVSVALVSDQMSSEELEEGSGPSPLFGRRNAHGRPPRRLFGVLLSMIFGSRKRTFGS